MLAHPDLVKVWGAGRPRPAAALRAFYELAIERIAAADVAIEVSTAGLRKPVGEIYPAPELLEMCLAAGKPVALSSDAHEPEQLGYGYDAAVELLREAGVERDLGLRRPAARARSRSDERRERRVGIGYDAHRFGGEWRRWCWAGCEIPGEPGLEGHSDADVVAHAVTDALLGAAGLGDIGEHFPDDDPRFADADSIELLARGAARRWRAAAGGSSTSTRP